MQRLTYGIRNSRIWHLCSQDIEENQKITLDNWTRYRGTFREIYYLNDDIKFLEIDNFNHTFKFLDAKIRSNNKEDFRKFFRDYLGYTEV
ncbi:hypothetical protein [Acholeplasma hippikon]|uniref:Uncharacterized protein n=1 Tax=Acholeplasma hippikon TaxID=264636 RepID=A0A449BK19_9MOLU|nr:hypothetical protein [Acholeplasma hippikon]VEU82733.1 Uncharacterised protein [Acholeplasma hippikon]